MLTAGFTSPDIAVNLEGTDQWRDAYFEISDIKFYGANQGPQAAARFTCSRPIYFTRLRYAVIRTCGPMAGVNLLENCKPVTAPILGIAQAVAEVRLFWPTNVVGFTLQTTPSLIPPQWTAVTNLPVMQVNQYMVTQPINGIRFYRLAK